MRGLRKCYNKCTPTVSSLSFSSHQDHERRVALEKGVRARSTGESVVRPQVAPPVPHGVIAREGLENQGRGGSERLRDKKMYQRLYNVTNMKQ